MVIIDGEKYPSGDKALRLLNRGLRYGDGLFETIRVYNGRLLFLPDHFDRLFRGMALLGFSFDREGFSEELHAALLTLLESAGLSQGHGRVRLQVYRKGEGAYLPLDNDPGYVIEGFSMKEDPYRSFSPITLERYSAHSLSPSPFSNFKTSNAFPYILAALHAQKSGVEDVVLFRGRHAAETSRSNLFVVRKQKVMTPPLTDACLDGVMRRQILRLCKELKVPVKEKSLTERDLLRADELFVTNTIRGIDPVARYGKQLFIPEHFAITKFLQQSLLRWVDNM